MMRLTEKQQRFVDEFLVDGDAEQAAIRSGYSPARAIRVAAQLLENPEVERAIQLAEQTRAPGTAISAEAVIRELAIIAFSDLRQDLAVGLDGSLSLKSLKDLPGASAIKKIKEKRKIKSLGENSEVLESQLEVEYHDKLKALEVLGKHLGLFSEGTAIDNFVEVVLKCQPAILQNNKGT